MQGTTSNIYPVLVAILAMKESNKQGMAIKNTQTSKFKVRKNQNNGKIKKRKVEIKHQKTKFEMWEWER